MDFAIKQILVPAKWQLVVAPERFTSTSDCHSFLVQICSILWLGNLNNAANLVA